MGADHSKTPTELEQYLILLQQCNAAGQPFVIVGGHAVNFWAKFYLEREPKLKDLLPFTSKDLDLIGTKEEAADAANTLQNGLSTDQSDGHLATSPSSASNKSKVGVKREAA